MISLKASSFNSMVSQINHSQPSLAEAQMVDREFGIRRLEQYSPLQDPANLNSRYRKLSLKAFWPKIVSNLGLFADRLTILVEHQTLKSEMATQIVLPRPGSSSFQKFIFRLCWRSNHLAFQRVSICPSSKKFSCQRLMLVICLHRRAWNRLQLLVLGTKQREAFRRLASRHEKSSQTRTKSPASAKLVTRDGIGRPDVVIETHVQIQ
jgi:hypothetical protein